MQTEGKIQTADQGLGKDCTLEKYTYVTIFPLSSANHNQTNSG